jgi:hypothetical protein
MAYDGAFGVLISQPDNPLAWIVIKMSLDKETKSVLAVAYHNSLQSFLSRHGVNSGLTHGSILCNLWIHDRKEKLVLITTEAQVQRTE